ncbi:MAG: MBL fold metallo-hydrolase [Aestuariivita sp.]|nr:MBL fold metallo-hydrolase [Aestuariivita sp.]
MTEQNGIYRFEVGSLDLTMISDGNIPMSSDIFPTINAEQFHSTLNKAGIATETYPSDVNAFVLNINGAIHLIDAGGGKGTAPTLGNLSSRLAVAGYSPDQVQTLMVTHLHPDHIGGAITESGAVFSNAEMILMETEYAFWTNAENKAKAGDDGLPFFEAAASAIDAYKNNLRLISGETDVLTGVTAIPLPGHTPGHCGFMISSDNDDLLIWSDIIHMPYLQFDNPNITVAFDVDPQQAINTRLKVLDQAETDQLKIAGMHLLFPAVGQIERVPNGGYQLISDSINTRC